MKLLSLLALILSASAIAGCAPITSISVTCTGSDVELSCGIKRPIARDPLAPSGAEDEKPVEPLTRPLQRLEEDAS